MQPIDYRKYKICVSGAAKINHCCKDIIKLAKEVGKEIVRQNGILITGATTGAPCWAAIGAKKAKGFSLGISPAASERDHVQRYKLPIEHFDLILYTFFRYPGRNLWLTAVSDGIIIVCGRIGTLNEFTTAFEKGKPIGVLEGSGGTADIIRDLLPKLHRGKGKIVYDSDPKKLVAKLIKLIEKERSAGVKLP